MTEHEIVDMAKEAASSAFDAHGSNPPSAKMAYGFIRHMRWESFEGSEQDATALWESMELTPDEFGLFIYHYGKTYAGLLSASAEVSHG